MIKATGWPTGWTCAAELWNDGVFCNCNCGVYDPDCALPSSILANCEGHICESTDVGCGCSANAECQAAGPVGKFFFFFFFFRFFNKHKK